MKFATILAVFAAAVAASPAAMITAAPDAALVEMRSEEAAACGPSKACVNLAHKVATCGQPCISSAAKAAGCGTNTNNFNCQCSKSAAIQSRAQNCVLNACGINTALSVQAEVNSVCTCNKNHAYTTCG